MLIFLQHEAFNTSSSSISCCVSKVHLSKECSYSSFVPENDWCSQLHEYHMDGNGYPKTILSIYVTVFQNLSNYLQPSTFVIANLTKIANLNVQNLLYTTVTCFCHLIMVPNYEVVFPGLSHTVDPENRRS